MADKYLIVGAAFYGDGTSSAEATVNGGVGAWNNINVLCGTVPTYGTLVSGDTLNVRSKTAAGADLYFGQSLGFVVGPASGLTGVTILLDGGTIWSGIAGTCTFDVGGSQEALSLRGMNTYIAYAKGAFKVRNVRSNYSYWITAAGITAKNLEFSYSNTVSDGAQYINITGSTLDSCIFSFALLPTGFTCTANSKAILIAPDIRLTSGTGASTSNGIFYMSVGASIEIYGGTVSGAGATASQALFYGGLSSGAAPEYTVVGLYAPYEMPLIASAVEGSPMFNLRMLGADKKASASIGASWGYADSRNDGYYPKLSATLPDTLSSGWSWKLKASFANAYRPAKLVLSKLYTGTATAKTITLELLISNSISASTNKFNVYMVVQYVDNATGNVVSETTKATGALATSTANWSATTYGAASFDKRKLALTTAGSIKQDTLVTVVLFVAYAATGANDLYFVDPDPSLT